MADWELGVFRLPPFLLVLPLAGVTQAAADW